MMMIISLPALSVLLVLAVETETVERVWTDTTGDYSTQAALVDFDKEIVVLKTRSGRLISLPIAKLSKADQDFLQSQDRAEVCKSHCAGNRTWVLRDGTKLAGQIVSYAPEKLNIQRRSGKVFVNDKPYRELPEDAQYVVRKIVEHDEKVPIPDDKAFEKWVVQLRGTPRDLHLEGVVLQSENGKMFVAPFFLFTADCEKFLRAGYEEWLAVQTKTEKASEEELDKQRQAELFLRAQAADYQRDQLLASLVELTAVETGLVDEWEVLLMPKPGVPGPPKTVIVPARNSMAASLVARAQNPQYIPDAVQALTRRRWR